LNGSTGDKRVSSTILKPSISTARPIAVKIGRRARRRATQSCARLLATTKAAAAPVVLPSDATTVPFARPNTNPAPSVSSDPGTNNTAAGT
jgi:hypothetical protein